MHNSFSICSLTLLCFHYHLYTHSWTSAQLAASDPPLVQSVSYGVQVPPPPTPPCIYVFVR